MKKLEIDISTWSIIKVFLVFLALWFLFSIKQILAIIFFALMLSSAIDDAIDKLVSKKFPRFLSVIIIFIFVLSIFSLIIFSIAEPLKLQGQELIKNFPEYYKAIQTSLAPFISTTNLFPDSSFLNTNFASTKNLFGTISSISGGITSFVLILVLTFYMSIETQALKKALSFVTPSTYHDFIEQLITKVQEKIGDWIRGQLFLSFIVGIVVYVGLKLLGVKYALVLALLAGLGEFIPYIGPMIATLTALFIAFTTAPIQAIFVAIFYGILQVIENHILVPKIMQKAVGLNPIIIICALLIGIKIGGAMGALIAIPTATALSVVVEEFSKNKHLFNNKK